LTNFSLFAIEKNNKKNKKILVRHQQNGQNSTILGEKEKKNDIAL